MSQRQNYKNRTVQVRKSARAQLQELRRQRMANRKEMTVVSHSSNVAVEAHHKTDAEAAALEVDLIEPQLDVDLAEPRVNVGLPQPELGTNPTKPQNDVDPQEPKLGADAPEPNQNADLPESPMDNEPQEPKLDETVSDDIVNEKSSHVPNDQFDDLSVENVAVSEMAEDVVSPSIQERVIDDSIEGSDPKLDESHASNSDDCDLFSLPGAGPGLVWMLNQCGVLSLADLAKADPAKLTTDLGVVGQILDVEKWITFAKDS